MASPGLPLITTLPAELSMLSLQSIRDIALTVQRPGMASTESATVSKLLALPAELGNAIYRYTLCDDNNITLTRYNYKLPALLHACTRTRKEASATYDIENTFDIDTPGFDPTVMLRFERDAQQLVDLDDITYYTGSDASSGYYWDNLRRWLKAFLTARRLVSRIVKRGRGAPTPSRQRRSRL
ncbi:hypothetical protein CLAFUW4_08851 [Fulvia fulva]|uniref:Uncharacterized protein n=1 Tax=Passalora fulva TaxID=5499 RepID=A0A9Q8UTI7_PASFU|nr:uncharacterized protein CLAFUR5_08957 [Fulvia fulva]KAK4613576.1 hypothetical protein CLAFUR4_08857 [Fulvia fulva]KAK4615078.1 hypothetical protein CLAFUR0_08849 [Fulvia fulva]UJO21984.1 hypothetical protein CLAFUR5_08957 [Fulvia fulva]WPV20339.1 hypothetical protein CLAFUW4_08851 [Fulvia fulva]WPV35435.1 hypothetical protein CLAFUW7_08852 [Fulvia fulva]